MKEELTFWLPDTRGKLDIKRHLRKALIEKYNIDGYDSMPTTVEGETEQDKLVDHFIIMLFKDELPKGEENE